MSLLVFEMLGVRIGIQCRDAELRALVAANWGQAQLRDLRPDVDVIYTVSRNGGRLTVGRPGNAPIPSADTGQLLHECEHEITVELQRRRSDLYFVHAAAAENNGRASLFVAESGGGKSTLLWALLHHGFGYLSDELAPIDVTALQVHPYPHALCLKHPPPPPYALPSESIATPRSWHVPAAHLPGRAAAGPCPLAALFFLKYHPDATTPQVRAISRGETSARLYAGALNQLAHPNAGLDAAVAIAAAVPGFVLDAAGLAATCALISDTA